MCHQIYKYYKNSKNYNTKSYKIDYYFTIVILDSGLPSCIINNINLLFNILLLFMDYKKKYLKYKKKYLDLKYSNLMHENIGSGFISDVKDLVLPQPKATGDLKKCAPNRMKQQSGTCWFNSIINIIILTDALRKNMELFIEKLKDEDKKIIESLDTFDKLDLKYKKNGDSYTSDLSALNLTDKNLKHLKLKHLVCALFKLFKTEQKPNDKQEFIADMAARVKSIGRYGKDKELEYISKSKLTNPKYFGTGYSAIKGMEIMMDYFKLNRNNDVILIKGPIFDKNKNLKLEINSNDIRYNNKSVYNKKGVLKENYTIQAICYEKLLGLHVSSGIRCFVNKEKFITYDSNNIIKYEDWYKTQSNKVLFSIYSVKDLKT